ncbi:MAG: hypothetical protein JO141_26995 [Bradyrhizobium sp.]|nr:hypothetical protein [Bradyrhizobium sp.]
MDQLQTTDSASVHIALIAIELSKTTWLLAMHDPITGKISRRRVDGGDADALIGILEQCRRDLQARTGETIGIECVFEAGYDGFWLNRRLAQAGIFCRVMNPASLKVDRRARRSKPTGLTPRACCGRFRPGAEATGKHVHSSAYPVSRRKTLAGRIASPRD